MMNRFIQITSGRNVVGYVVMYKVKKVNYNKRMRFHRHDSCVTISNGTKTTILTHTHTFTQTHTQTHTHTHTHTFSLSPSLTYSLSFSLFNANAY